jgi:hypothetical protein
MKCLKIYTTKNKTMKTLFKALAEFQQEVPVIHKGTSGYGYSYADLPAIFEVINPLLKKHKLGFTQPIMGDTIKTIIFHTESGEVLESLTEIPKNVQLAKMNEFQVLGSAITYIRRYALSSILGLVTEKDTDASGEQVKPLVKEKPILKPEGLTYLLSDKSSKQEITQAINERKLTEEQKSKLLTELKTKK